MSSLPYVLISLLIPIMITVICLIVQFLLTLTHNALVIIYGTFALMVLQLVPLIVTFVLVERKLKQNDS